MNNIGSEYKPSHLGIKSSEAISKLDLIPWTGGKIAVELVCKEFTSLCPVTGQPDFGELTLRYQPNKCIVETKSMKLYLIQFRDKGVFSEDIVSSIADDIFNQLQPAWLEIEGRFASRGGIAINVQASREAEEPT